MAKKAITKPYEPTPRETEIIEAHRAKAMGKKPAPTIKLVKNTRGKYEINIDHEDQSVGWTLFTDSLNSTDSDFIGGLTYELVSAASLGQEPNESDANYWLCLR